MSLQDTYHVTLGKRRTTVSVDDILSVIFALKLGTEPGTTEARAAIRNYLQGKLDEANDSGRDYVSQWLREKMLFDIMDKKISKLYWDWFDEHGLEYVQRKRRRRHW